MRIWLGLLFASLIAGCESDSPVKSLRDYELAERNADCLEHQPTAPGRVQACENIRRECERRREELGIYVCGAR